MAPQLEGAAGDSWGFGRNDGMTPQMDVLRRLFFFRNKSCMDMIRSEKTARKPDSKKVALETDSKNCPEKLVVGEVLCPLPRNMFFFQGMF